MEPTVNPLIRTEVIELNIQNNVTNSYSFQQQPNLREAKMILDVEAYDASQVPLSKSNKTVIPNSVLIKSYLQLVELGGSNATIRTVPLYDINTNGAAGKSVQPINCQPIDWEKTTVVVPETTGLVANMSFIFKVRYIKAK